MMPADDSSAEPRRKRAKIVSACSECRRKKTKCNGEQPCRSCQKSSVPCVYPSSHVDDRRNVPSKAALEAIEDRLKTIEDMLKTILQSHLPVADLDPVAVNNFLHRTPSSPSPLQHASHPPPPPQQQHYSPRPPSHPDLRLPSIHHLPASTSRHDLPPLPQQDYQLHKPDDYTLHKRKR